MQFNKSSVFAAVALCATLFASSSAYAADADATGIVPKLAISFNDKTLTSVGSVAMAGQSAVPAEKFVEATNGCALDMDAVGSAVTLYSGSTGQLSGNSSADTAAPFSVSIFGTVPNTARQILFQAQYYTSARGVSVGFDASGKLTYWWVGNTTGWSTAQNITMPENHDWTKVHHYVFSFGNGTDGIMRFYVDGQPVSTLSPLNNYKAKESDGNYRNPAAKSYQGLYLGNGFAMNNYSSTAGIVDDVRFYADSGAAQAIDGVNYVLSDAMVEKLYRNLIGDDAVVKIGTAGYDSLAAALAVVQPGQTLTLNDNIVLTESAAIPAGVDIDFGSYTITTTTEGVALSATSDIYTISSTTADSTTTFAKTYLDNVIVWNGASGASWGTPDNWLVKGETATALPSASDTAIFPQHLDSSRTVAIDAAVSAGAVVFNGKYTISGDYALTATSLKVSGTGEFTIGSATAYTGAIAVDGTSGIVRVDVGADVEYTIGGLSLTDQPSDLKNRNCYLYIDSGVVSFSNTCRMHTSVEAGATAIVTANLTSYVRDYYQWFLGTGDLVFNGATLDMSGKGDYGSAIARFAGTLTLTNSASVTFSNNNNTTPVNALGTGKVVLAGCTLGGGNEGGAGYVFGNSSIEVVAGTVNTCTSTFALPLDKVVVTGGLAELTKAQRTVLTTTKGTLTTGAAISDETKAFGWKVKTVVNAIEQAVSNYTVELYKSGFAIILR